MSQKKRRSDIPDKITLPDGTVVEGLPKAVIKAYSPRCKCCQSEFYLWINQMLADGKRNSWIAKKLASFGEIISPQAIGRHKKAHLKDMATVRAFQMGLKSVNAREEICAQINLTKIELEDTADREHRRFLMRRMDSLLKQLVDYDTKMSKNAATRKKIVNVDARQQQVNVVNDNRSQPSPPMSKEDFEELQEEMRRLRESVVAGDLRLIDGDSGELVDAREGGVIVLSEGPMDEDDL